MPDLLQQAQTCIAKYLTPRSKLNKAAFSTTDLTTGGGLLAPQQARRFVQLIRFRPGLLNKIRIAMMRGPTERIDRITFGSRILHASTEGSALAANLQSTPDTSKLEVTTQEYTAEVQLTYDSLQDSIEGGQNVRGNKFENTIFQMIASRVAEDIEALGLLSDSSDAGLHADFQVQDGWLKQARDSITYDHNGVAINKGLFKGAHLALPKQYRQDKRSLRFIISPNTDIEWMDEQADRVTVTGDAVPWGDKHPDRAYGIPTIIAGDMPEESGSSSNLGQMLHTHPKNIGLGLWRRIFMEIDRDIRARTLIVVTTIRMGFFYEQVEGAMVAQNFKVS